MYNNIIHEPETCVLLRTTISACLRQWLGSMYSIFNLLTLLVVGCEWGFRLIHDFVQPFCIKKVMLMFSSNRYPHTWSYRPLRTTSTGALFRIIEGCIQAVKCRCQKARQSA
ncbi:uncharacterized protein ASPGLDRAFT_918376 [Aspergillus glaucus CBS 516.65]|uniref:Uncharacterized protein n=1 Tax=Aspergillus glaucus CBS 516.65 TaxID=1160497 RepID=A0A1L9V7H0_ASPGL|nr:hypothetical protein ASPGLDRAFT_918376 [Aspergillus glaucus CBS 516.65]OJJ79868.1 hypothetical protein ASPGLDRAFT_918376 [Aspergillus glaucus CBS 516.65]